jgi:uncharacterized damage-inducible protein DinB
MNTADIFISRSRYWLIKEYPIKLRHCVNVLPSDATWKRPDAHSNSIGNLLVHLTGNVSEWILGGIGRQSITRHRAREFSQRDGADGATLLANLEAVLRQADEVLAGLSEERLQQPIRIQGRETTVLGAIYHVVEHFAMHTGQIVFLTKIYAPGTIHFYEDATDDARPLWQEGSQLQEAAH